MFPVSFIDYRNSVQEKQRCFIRGKLKEEKIAKLCLMLKDVSDVIVSENGTSLDYKQKIDIVLCTKDNIGYGFQVKSSVSGAKQFLKSNYIHFDTINSLPPGVFYVDDYVPNLKILAFLSKWLDRPVKESYKNLFLYFKKYRNKKILKTALNLEQLNTFKFLNLISFDKDPKYILFK
jgi:hypothetical protein